MDAYDTMELPLDADEDAIKKAFKKLAILHHPDKNQGKEEEADAKFIKVKAAYDILSVKERKKIYDTLGLDIGETTPDDFLWTTGGREVLIPILKFLWWVFIALVGSWIVDTRFIWYLVLLLGAALGFMSFSGKLEKASVNGLGQNLAAAVVVIGIRRWLVSHIVEAAFLFLCGLAVIPVPMTVKQLGALGLGSFVVGYFTNLWYIMYLGIFVLLLAALTLLGMAMFWHMFLEMIGDSAKKQVKDMRLAVRAERTRAEKAEAEVTRLKEALRK
jgi:hypothetical protein